MCGWRSEDNLTLYFYHVAPGYELRSSILAVGAFTRSFLGPHVLLSEVLNETWAIFKDVIFKKIYLFSYLKLWRED